MEVKVIVNPDGSTEIEVDGIKGAVGSSAWEIRTAVASRGLGIFKCEPG